MNEKMNTPLGSAFPKERVRYAMLSFFLAQGLCFSSWASRIPDVKDFFEVNYAFYWGLVLFLIPVGKFVAIPLAGYLVSRLGSRIMAQASVLQSRFEQYLANLEEKGIQILEKNVMIEKADQKYVVTGTVDAYESIVSYQPTEILEITSEERQQPNESD